MTTTFETWQRSREEVADVIDHAGYSAPGFVYDLGFIIKSEGRFSVPIANTERNFATLDEAEAYIWRAFVCGELTGEDPQ